MTTWRLNPEQLDNLDPRNVLIAVFDTNGALRYIRADALSPSADTGEGLYASVIRNVGQFNDRGASVTVMAADSMGHLYPVELAGAYCGGGMEMVSNEPPLHSREDGNVMDVPDLDMLSRMICAQLDALGQLGFELRYNRKARCYVTRVLPLEEDKKLDDYVEH